MKQPSGILLYDNGARQIERNCFGHKRHCRMFRVAWALFACGITFAAHASAATLVGQYLFNNFVNLGLDSSGNGNNLTTTIGTPGQTTGPTGGTALLLNGASSLQRLTGLTGYNGLPGFSFSAWVDITGPGTGGFNGVITQDGSVFNRLLVRTSDNAAFIDAGQASDQVLGPVPPNNTWFLYTMTALTSGGATSVHVYVNGLDVSGSPLTLPFTLPDGSSANTYLGTGENGNRFFMTGKMADVRIYQGALTGAEVTSLFQSGPAGVSAPEPCSTLLFGSGLVAVALRRFRPCRSTCV